MNKSDFISHEHCSICIKSYPSKEDAEKCFWNHSEIEKLRWIANRVHNIKIWRENDVDLNHLDYELFSKIDSITKEYNIGPYKKFCVN